MTPSTKRVSHRGSLLKGVAVYRGAVSKHIKCKVDWKEEFGVGKGAQATGMTECLRIQSSKADSNTWGELHKEWTEAGVSASRVNHAQDVFRKELPSHF